MNVYILSGARTPSGSFMGCLSTVPAPRLGAAAIAGALEKANISGDKVEEVFMGCVIPAGLGQAPARQASIYAGLPKSVPCTTLNKVCGSGLKTIIEGARAIKCGDASVIVAGGMENMSAAPYLLPNARTGFRFGSTEAKDAMQWDGLWDAYGDQPMGNFAELCAEKYNFTREMQDEFAIRSFKRAQEAQNEGIYKSEIVPVTVPGRRGDTIIEEDEGPAKVKFDKIPKLRPAFKKDGTITAANASSINDGAAAVVLAGEEYKDQAKFRIVGYSGCAQEPDWFTTAPIEAMKLNLEKAKLKIEDIDLFEVNEAFAVVSMAAQKEFNIPSEKLNVYGGAVSLGHPIGVSGTRIMVTLMNALERKQKRYGMASICIGGGEALSMIIERL